MGAHVVRRAKSRFFAIAAAVRFETRTPRTATKTMSVVYHMKGHTLARATSTVGTRKMTVGHYMHMKMPYFRDTIPRAGNTKELARVIYDGNNTVPPLHAHNITLYYIIVFGRL